MIEGNTTFTFICFHVTLTFPFVYINITRFSDDKRKHILHMLPSCIFVLLFWGSVSFKTKTKQSPLTTKAVWWSECLLAYRYVCTGLIWGLWTGCIHQDGTCHGNGDGSVLKGTWMHLEDMQVTVCGEERRTFTGRNMVSGEVVVK